MRESRRDKVDLFKKALISSAGGKYKPVAQEQLMRHLESLTPEHIQVLGWAHESARALTGVATLEDAFSVFVRSTPGAHREGFRSIVHDLTNRFLIVLVDIDGHDEYESEKQVLITENGEGRPQLMVTAQGRQLFDFIYAA